MQFKSTLYLLAAAATASTARCAGFINTTKVSAAYWRATFSNPPMNIQDAVFYQDFHSLVDQIAGDPDVKVIVFDSAVPDFWMAHFDIISGAPADVLGEAYWRNVTLLANLPVLTVAAVQGIARGGGSELAAALDVRFASREKAIFGQIEVGFGVVPGGGGIDLLPRLVGRSRALEIVIGADDFDADTAAAYGWINRAIPDDKFEDFVDTFARRVAAWDSSSIAAAKRIVNERSVFPTVAELKESYGTFVDLFEAPTVQARVQAAIQAGAQTNVSWEKNLGQELLLLV